MTLFLQRVLDGLANGSLYGSLALTIVLVYRAGGRLNLAQGEFATVGTYLSLVFSSPPTAALAGTTLASHWLVRTPWPMWVAIPLAMACSAALAGAVQRFVVQRIPASSTRSTVSVTIGLLLLINSLTKRWWKPVQRGYRSPFPNAPNDQFMIAGARLRYTTVGTWVTLVLVLGLLWIGLRVTKAGLAFRAVSDDRTSAALCGIRVKRVLTGGWALAAAVGTLVGCFAANRLVLNPDLMVRLLVYGFAAAVIGGLTSLAGSLVGGLALGVSQSLLAGYVHFIRNSLAFPAALALMVLVLYLRPRGLFLRRPTIVADPTDVQQHVVVNEIRPQRVVVAGTTTARVLRSALAVSLLVFAVVPAFVLPYVEGRLWTEILATTVVLWGLSLLMGPARQLSLGHAAFAGIGAYSTAIVAARYGWSAFAGLAVAIVAGFLFGILLGLPALRIRGQYLAIVTLGVSVAFPMVIQRFSWFTGGELGPKPTSPPQPPAWLPFPTWRTFGWLHLIAVVATLGSLVVLRNLTRSAPGRSLRAAAENEVSAAAMGINVTRTLTMAFGLSAAFGALGGSLLALQTQAVTTAGFDLFRSLALFAVLMLAGVDSLAGAFVGAFILVATPWTISKLGWKIGANMIYGALLVVSPAIVPNGIADMLLSAVRRRIWIVEDTGPHGTQNDTLQSDVEETSVELTVLSN